MEERYKVDEFGHIERLVLAKDAIEHGVKNERIPMAETLKLLRDLFGKYPEPLPEDELSECIDLMDKISRGVESGWIPEDEAVMLLEGLNKKYPL